MAAAPAAQVFALVLPGGTQRAVGKILPFIIVAPAYAS
jgi:hypothetical protein